MSDEVVRARCILGDCVEAMRSMDANSVDAVVCDPPYGLELLGKGWDNLGRARAMRDWHEQWAVEAIRVMKPGAHLVAFGGTRTYHHLASGIEASGAEIRDSLVWLYGSGFPKSHNLQGEWDGWGTALKPSFEPVVLARKPLAGTVEQNMEWHGVGALNVRACRVGERWPANAALDEDAVTLLEEEAGRVPRFYYCAKPSKDERNLGTDSLAAKVGSYTGAFWNKSEKLPVGANHHPSAKPIALMRWLVRLVAPVGSIVLDPFMGSGSTGCGAVAEGCTFVGIERDSDYLAIAEARIDYWAKEAA